MINRFGERHRMHSTFPIPIPRRLNLSSVFVYSTSHVLQHEPLSYASICHCLHDKTIAFNLQNQPEPLQTVSHCSVSIYHTRPQSRRVVFFFNWMHIGQCHSPMRQSGGARAFYTRIATTAATAIIIKKIAACTHSIDTLGSVLTAQIFNVFFFHSFERAVCCVSTINCLIHICMYIRWSSCNGRNRNDVRHSIAIYATNEQNEWVMSGASFLSIK